MRDAIREAEQILFYIRSAQGLLDCFLDYGKFGVVKGDTQAERCCTKRRPLKSSRTGANKKRLKACFLSLLWPQLP